MAFHNNTNSGSTSTPAATLRARPAGLNIRWYESGGHLAGDAEQDPARSNPAIQASQDPDNFLLVTRPEDFDRFSGQRNVVLQAGSPTDDGSLSVVLAGERYINIEAQGKPYRGHSRSRFINNRSMALEVFREMGIPARPCIGAQEAELNDELNRRTRPHAEELERTLRTARRWAEHWHGEEFDSLPEQEADSLQRRAMRRYWQETAPIRQDVQQRLQALRDRATGTTLPCPTGSRGLVFCSTQELVNRKAIWARRIGEMNTQTVIQWITGQTDCENFTSTLAGLRRGSLTSARRDQLVLCEAFQEAQSQITALRAAMPDASARGTRSPLRDFGDQQTIWEQKYLFDPRRGTFGSIRQEGHDACVSSGGTSSDFPVGGEWDTGNSAHQHCWGNVLTPNQRQQEILQTSSAPGISRHHFGTDVDLGSGSASLTNAAWSSGGQFESAYQWLEQNALAHGMIQSFTAGRSGGYLEERWHWSYYPIAQALVEFADANQSGIQTELTSVWDARVSHMASAGQISRAQPQEDPYSFVRSHWRDFVFQVLQTPGNP